MKISKSQEVFSDLYRSVGVQSQRRYPSESVVRFVATQFGHVPPPERKGISVLDMGCGSGSNLTMLMREGFYAIGLDSSTESLLMASDLCLDWGLKRPALISGSFLQIPLSDESIDCVIDVVSLQHLDLRESSDALAEIARFMKPKGKFYSYRLSDNCSIVRDMRTDTAWIDSNTVSNIPANLPLGNNGPTSFWNEEITLSKYAQVGLEIEEITRVARSYTSGRLIEYLEITSSRMN